MKKNWIITLVSAFFLFYGLFQSNIMGALADSLIRDFKINATELGLISAVFFYSYLIFILPAGLLTDRIYLKKIILVNMSISILGTAIFALSNSLFFIAVGRLLTGISAPFGMLACMKITAILIPKNRLGLAFAIVTLIGKTGAMCAQGPMGFLVNSLGWRNSLWTIVFFGIMGIILLIVLIQLPKNEPIHGKQKVFENLMLTIKNPKNWFGAIFISMLNTPIAILGALFGINYLEKAHSIPYLSAASMVSFLFLGTISGSLIIGWLSDHLKTSKKPMFWGSLACLICTMILIYCPILPIWSLYTLLFFIGFTNGSVVLGFSYISKNNPHNLVATALSLAAILYTGISYGLGLPLVGKLLDLSGSYSLAFSIIPVGILISFLVTTFIKD